MSPHRSRAHEAGAAQDVVKVTLTAVPGKPVVPLPEGRRYLGSVFARGGDPAEVEQAPREAVSRLIFRIQAG